MSWQKLTYEEISSTQPQSILLKNERNEKWKTNKHLLDKIIQMAVCTDQLHIWVKKWWVWSLFVINWRALSQNSLNPLWTKCLWFFYIVKLNFTPVETASLKSTVTMGDFFGFEFSSLRLFWSILWNPTIQTLTARSQAYFHHCSWFCAFVVWFGPTMMLTGHTQLWKMLFLSLYNKIKHNKDGNIQLLLSSWWCCLYWSPSQNWDGTYEGVYLHFWHIQLYVYEYPEHKIYLIYYIG